jgi:L-fucose/D-arabinose isomerase
MNSPIKVGLLSTLSPDYSVDREGKEVYQMLLEARDHLQALGMIVFDLDRITQSHQQAAKDAKELTYRGAEVLVIYIGRWSYSNAIVAAALESRLPIILWTNARHETTGIIGTSIAHGALAEVGIDAPIIHANFEEKPSLERIKSLCRVRAAATRLRKMTYGVCGGRTLAMYPAVIDGNAWRTQFGIEVDAFDQAGVIAEAERISPARVKPYISWIRDTFGEVKVSDDILDAQVRLYLATKDIITLRGYDFVSVRCLPEMPCAYTSFCLAHSLLNDSSDAEGSKPRIICACEADSNGALTMQLMSLLTDEPVAFGDIFHYDKQRNVIYVSNCGSQPTDMAKSRKNVNWVPTQMTEFNWKIGAACPQHVSKPGTVTVARMARVAGRYVCSITTGKALDVPIEEMTSDFWGFSPHTYVQLSCDHDTFINQLRSEHLHITYGDLKDELSELCQIFNVEPIII